MKSKGFKFNCSICNKEVHVEPAQIKWRNRQTCSITCRGKARRIKTLERHNNLPLKTANRLARRMPELVEWRKGVFERDDYTCQICGIRGTYLEADHILPFAYFPQFRHELSNGRTLCRPCHDKTKRNWRVMKKQYATLIAEIGEARVLAVEALRDAPIKLSREFLENKLKELQAPTPTREI